MFMDCMMEHMARELSMDPLEFRKLNLMEDGIKIPLQPVPFGQRRRIFNKEIVSGPMRSLIIEKSLIGDMITQLENEADVANRKATIATFNTVS